MTRKICYITGTRADFGLMQATLTAIHKSDNLDLAMLVTGMHLAEQYGQTVRDIQATGLPIAACIEVDMGDSTGASMARGIGNMVTRFVDALVDIQPDLVLLLGDRGEMLAGAIAAIHLNIPVVHVHGGERSGTVDEPVRHAISKLSHFHFTATMDARDRLIRMGERGEHVFVTGAPGLVGLESLASVGRAQLIQEVDFDPLKPVALMVYHPVLQEAASAGLGAARILDVLSRKGIQVLALKPNADAGSHEIRQMLESRAHDKHVRVVTHFPRENFVSWMAAADMMIGNSSAGIIEAGTFGTPVINVGGRQNLRERNANVLDVPVDSESIEHAIDWAIRHGRFDSLNIYGDGESALRIVNLLQNLSLNGSALLKSNAY
jgi:GDP/UDP-N,N'-diacetylbacillosamine 2-epimerase (hydrolysing)